MSTSDEGSVAGCSPYNDLLSKNQLFYDGVMATVAAKNKMDSMSKETPEARDQTIRCLLKAIACKKTDYLNTPKVNSLATHTLAAQTGLHFRAMTKQLKFTGSPDDYTGGKRRTKRRKSKGKKRTRAHRK